MAESNGFDKKVWKELSSGPGWLELLYYSKDGEEGYPGNLQVIIRFELNEENELSYAYKAASDQPTPVNLSHHSYFNLNGSGTIDTHELKIDAAARLGQDENLVANGILIPVRESIFDFRKYKKLSSVVDKLNCFDISYVVDESADKQDELKLVASLRSVEAGLELQVYSTEPIVHFYAGRWIPVVPAKYNLVYGPYSGLCLETQLHPNALNLAGFPNTIIYPGEGYYQKTVYKLIR